MKLEPTIKHYPLSSPQREIWFDQVLHPEVPLYNIGGYVQINGAIDPVLFESAVNLLVQRHDALRTVLVPGTGDLPVQTFLEDLPVIVPFHDFSGENHPPPSALAWMQKQFVQPFDWYEKPLFDFALLKIDDHCFFWFMKYHHLIVDGWGVSLITQSLAEIYTQFIQGGKNERTAPSYLAFVENDRAYIESERFEVQRQYWLEKYQTLPEPLFIPRYMSRFVNRISPGERRVLWLSRLLYNRLLAFAKNIGSTLFHVMLGALYVNFTRTTQREELAIGLPILNRSNAIFKETVGLFIGVCAAWFQFGTTLSFRQLLKAIGNALKSDYRHQRLPISELNHALGIRKMGRKQLFDIRFNYAKHDYDTEFGGFKAKVIALTNDSEQIPLTISVWEFHKNENVQVDFIYNLAYFNSTEIESIQSRFALILEYVLNHNHVDESIGTIPLLTEAEKQQLLAWNQTGTHHPKDLTIVDLFQAQVEKTPDHIAVVFEGQALSYGELNTKANQFGHYLMTLGVGAETLVGICAQRSLEMVIGLLGILKAGGAYVPLDPDYPPSRLWFMLEDSGLGVLLTQGHLLEQLPASTAQVVCLDGQREPIAGCSGNNPVRQSGPENLAYVIYTSGSTGMPKGCQVTRSNVTRLFAVTEALYHFNHQDVWTLFHSYAFDFSVWETWGALRHGARLVVVSYFTSRTPGDFYQLLLEQRVTVLNQTPSAFKQLIDVDNQPGELSLRLVIFGGEVLDFAVLQPWFARHGDKRPRLVNMYGITETTVHVTYYPLISKQNHHNSLIGSPLFDLQVWVVDAFLQPVPIGIPGEMVVCGAGVARGYLNRPELTAEKFDHDLWDYRDYQDKGASFGQDEDAFGEGDALQLRQLPKTGATSNEKLLRGVQGGGFLEKSPPGRRRQKIYKTGDLARWLPDGNLEFLGRLDQQVKLRGFRIELPEIEAFLSRHEAVKEAVVVLYNKEDNPCLAAYVTLAMPIDDAAGVLRTWLKTHLPEYMVPASFTVLDQLPLTPNGKIDRKALQEMKFPYSLSKKTFVPPRTDEEKLLVRIWMEVLGIEQVGVHDNFFELGGHSLLATRIVSQVRNIFGVELPLQDLFEFPTPGGLIARIQTLRREKSAGAEEKTFSLPTIVAAPELRYQPFLLTDIQQAYWMGRSAAFELGNIATHVYLELDCDALDLKRLNHALQKLIERHEMLRMVVLPTGQQRILEQVPAYRIRLMDLCGQTPGFITTKLEATRGEMSHQMLSTEQWPLFEVRATRMDEQRIRLHLSFDGLVTDAMSLHIVAKEWVQLYQNPDQELAPLTLSFRDYVLAEQAWLENEVYQYSLAYWRGRLDTLPPAPQLPLALNPAALTKPKFQRRSARLEAHNWQLLKQRAAQAFLTPSAVLLTAFADILTLWCKQPRFTLNLTLFNRLPIHQQVNDIVGDFTSLILLEVDNTLPAAFIQRARRLQQQLWQDMDHRYVNGVRVQQELARKKGSPQRAMMPVVFTSTLTLDFEQKEFAVTQIGEIVYSITQTPQVWLDHQVYEESGTLVLNWDAIEELFPQGLLDDMFETYYRFLRQMVDSRAVWLETSTHALLPPWQLSRRTAANTTKAPVSEELLHTLFTARVSAQGHECAVISPRRTLTYRELFQLANQVGGKLRQLGASPDTLVAVVMEKGWEQVVAVLGILMSGAAYLPISPGLPEERRRYLLEYGEVKLALTQCQLNQDLEWPGGIQRICLDDDDFQGITASPLESVQKTTDLAYVIFTSGSTGQPKGVMIDHRGAVNTINDINQRFGVVPQDRVLALSALSFDLSVYDIFGILAGGGTIVIPGAGLAKDPAHWAEMMIKYHVTIWNTVPALMQMLVDYIGERPEIVPASPRLILMSGDWIPLNLAERIKALWPQVQVVSLGGATEASIWSICCPIEAIDSAWKSIPYGKPLRNQTFHVFNQLLEPCPIWVPGHLYIGGRGLARGYWRDEEKTRTSFIIHPHTRERLYKTGDLGRYLPDGNIEFLGREDFQVKIRGCRIELGEIETALQQHRMIKDAVVNVVGESNQRLAAYIVLNQDDGKDYLPGKTKDVILDPVERLEFKLKQPGLRGQSSEATGIPLIRPQFDETLRQAYLERQSYREFLDEPISFEAFSLLLSSLLQMKLEGAPLPKYRYASAGNLYPVQTYLSIKPDRVQRLDAGIYYYHPAEHRLVLLHAGEGIGENAYGGYGDFNQRIFEQSAFSLFLIGGLDAITPLYGDWSRDFCLLEAGYMSQLLMEIAPKHQIGLCPIGSLNFDAYRALFHLEENQILLHSFLGGGIAPDQKGQWLQSSHRSLSAAESLRHYLEKKLPAYMIPSIYISLKALPLTTNGKVDRGALPAPGTLPDSSREKYTAPRTPTEKMLVTFWSELLKTRPIGIHDDFFKLGGDSLLATRFINKVRETIKVDLPLLYLFEIPTVAKLAKCIEAALAEPGKQVSHDDLDDYLEEEEL